MGALWIHEGGRVSPHVSAGIRGLHYDALFRAEGLLEDPSEVWYACRDVCEVAGDAGYAQELKTVNRVVCPGAEMSGFAAALAEVITTDLDGVTCRRAYTEERPPNRGRLSTEKWSFVQTRVAKGEIVLLATTHVAPDTIGRLESTVKAIESTGGKLLPFIATIVDQSYHDDEFSFVGKLMVIPLLHVPTGVWSPSDCRHNGPCKDGSDIIDAATALSRFPAPPQRHPN